MRPIDLVSACHGFGSHLDDPGGVVGDSHITGAGMLVVSLRVVSFGFRSHLGCSGQTPLYLAVNVSFRVACEEILKNYAFSICFISSNHVIRVLNGLF